MLVVPAFNFPFPISFFFFFYVIVLPIALQKNWLIAKVSLHPYLYIAKRQLLTKNTHITSVFEDGLERRGEGVREDLNVCVAV